MSTPRTPDTAATEIESVAWVNPHPYLRVVGHCYIEHGYDCATAPQKWQSVGALEVLPLGAVYWYTGRRTIGSPSHPVVYADGRPAGRLVGVYQELTEQAFQALLPTLPASQGWPSSGSFSYPNLLNAREPRHA